MSEHARIILSMSPWELDLYASMGGHIPAERRGELSRYRDEIKREVHRPNRRELAIAEIRAGWKQRRHAWTYRAVPAKAIRERRALREMIRAGVGQRQAA